MTTNIAYVLLGIVVSCVSYAEAEEKPEPKDVFVEKFPEEGKPFFPSIYKKDHSLSSIENAPPAYIIQQLCGGSPLVGGQLLPKDRYFSISFEKGSEREEVNATLGKLSELLKLKIVKRQYEGDFLVVRLGEEGFTRKWEPAAEVSGTFLTAGVDEDIDGNSKTYRGYGATISEFLDTFACEDEMPILNRTGFQRGYNFIFERNGESREEVIRKAGFSVTKEKTKWWACVVISPE